MQWSLEDTLLCILYLFTMFNSHFRPFDHCTVILPCPFYHQTKQRSKSSRSSIVLPDVFTVFFDRLERFIRCASSDRQTLDLPSNRYLKILHSKFHHRMIGWTGIFNGLGLTSAEQCHLTGRFQWITRSGIDRFLS